MSEEEQRQIKAMALLEAEEAKSALALLRSKADQWIVSHDLVSRMLSLAKREPVTSVIDPDCKTVRWNLEISQRYQAADRNGKKLILDEFVKLTSYHRKHAIRLLTTEGCTHQGRQVGRRTYREAVKEALIVLWEASDRICGKRLKSLLPSLIEAMERHGHLHLQDGVKEQLVNDG
jgi:hypothetical protein